MYVMIEEMEYIMSEKEKNINGRALRAGGWYIFNNFLQKGIVFITAPIFSRLLTKEEVGLVSNFQSWLTVLSIICSLDLYSSIQRSKLDFEEDLDGYLSSILTLSTIVTLIFWINSIIFKEYICDLLGMTPELMNFLFIYILFYTAFNFLQTKHRVCLEYKAFTVISISTTVLNFFAALTLVFLIKEKYWGKILGDNLPVLCISILLYLRIMIKGKKYFNKTYWTYALSLSVPLIPHHLAGNILSQFDRIMITNICGYEKTAIYSMAYNVALILSIVWSSFNGAWSPWFYEQLKKEEYEKIKKISDICILAFFIITLGLITMGPEIILFMAPKSYYEGIYIIPIVLFGIFFQFIYSMYVNIEFYRKNTKYIPLGTMLSAGLNVLLNAVLIPKYGYAMAAYTTLAGYIFLYAFHFIISKRMIAKEIYNEKYIFKFIAFIPFVIMIYNYLYEKLVLRYVVSLVIILIILLINRKRWEDFFHNKKYFRRRG